MNHVQISVPFTYLNQLETNVLAARQAAGEPTITPFRTALNEAIDHYNGIADPYQQVLDDATTTVRSCFIWARAAKWPAKAMYFVMRRWDATLHDLSRPGDISTGEVVDIFSEHGVLVFWE